MKKSFEMLILFALVATSFCGCEDEIYRGNWIEISTLSAKERANASVFTIDDKAYIIGGYGYMFVPTYFNTTYVFDINDYSWSECDSLPCSPRRAGVAFAINGKGYFCGGISSDGAYHDELFEFDPSKPSGSQWTLLESDPYPNGGFYDGIGFAIGDCGYVGSGITLEYGVSYDYFKFDPSKPAGSRWTMLKTPGAAKRHSASVFVINDKAYILGGQNNGYKVVRFECYDALNDEFAVISDNMLADYNIDILYRYSASAFSVGNCGYLTCGVKFTGEVLRDTWRFTPDINNGKGAWQMMPDFEGSSRYNAPCFSSGRYGFLLCGQNGISSISFKDDVWRFSPDEKYNKRTSR